MTSDLENRTFSDKFMLRLPDGMRDKIKAAADTNGRSMNREIVATLSSVYSDREGQFMKQYASEYEAAHMLISEMRKTLAMYEAKLEMLRNPPDE